MAVVVAPAAQDLLDVQIQCTQSYTGHPLVVRWCITARLNEWVGTVSPPALGIQTFRSLEQATRAFHPTQNDIYVLNMWQHDGHLLMAHPHIVQLYARVVGKRRSTQLQKSQVQSSKPMLRRKVVRQQARRIVPRVGGGSGVTGPVDLAAEEAPRLPSTAEDEKEHPVESEWPDLHALPAKKWTERTLHAFFQRPDRRSRSPPNGKDPEMLGIEKLQRYGPDAMYRFYCRFAHPRTGAELYQWVIYTDFLANPQYLSQLSLIDFSIEEARALFLTENEDSADWSDGIDDDFGNFALDHATPADTRRKKKKKQRYPFITVDQWKARHDNGGEDEDDDDAPPRVTDEDGGDE